VGLHPSTYLSSPIKRLSPQERSRLAAGYFDYCDLIYGTVRTGNALKKLLQRDIGVVGMVRKAVVELNAQ
jgi:hypothetical protein